MYPDIKLLCTSWIRKTHRIGTYKYCNGNIIQIINQIINQ